LKLINLDDSELSSGNDECENSKLPLSLQHEMNEISFNKSN